MTCWRRCSGWANEHRRWLVREDRPARRLHELALSHKKHVMRSLARGRPALRSTCVSLSCLSQNAHPVCHECSPLCDSVICCTQSCEMGHLYLGCHLFLRVASFVSHVAPTGRSATRAIFGTSGRDVLLPGCSECSQPRSSARELRFRLPPAPNLIFNMHSRQSVVIAACASVVNSERRQHCVSAGWMQPQPCCQRQHYTDWYNITRA